jgi:prephenate dehydratase
MPDGVSGESKGPRVQLAEGPVAYQGAPGAFSEDAALRLCGAGTTLLPCRTLEDVFRALALGEAAAAVLPVENSIAGDVPGCRELIAQHHLQTRKTIALPIVHALVASSMIALDDVREVHSHPMALAQCRRFIAAHPRMLSVPVFDTAGALAELMQQPPGAAAAIASRRAAAHWGGVVLQDAIQDRADNSTEFWLVTPTRLTRAVSRQGEIGPKM